MGLDVSAQAQIDDLVHAVRTSAKYRTISEDLIRQIGLRELAARRTLKEAIKATKNKLHQVAGAYFEAQPRYADWLAELAAARDTQLREVCLRIMRHHASTRERVGILSSFYTTTLAGSGPVRAVLDVACGLNPLAIPWMPFGAEVVYTACDIYSDMVAFLNAFFAIAGINGRAEVCNLLAAPPQQEADLALVLKVIPPLEQLEPGAGLQLLRALNAGHLLVSFPVRSLGGRAKGMVEHYEQRFRALVAAERWSIQRFEFATELAFLVTK